MKFNRKRASAAAATLMAGSLVLTACSNADKNSNGSGSEGGDSNYPMADVQGTVNGEGASSQQNAMENVFLPAFSQDSSTLEYNSTGSGAGQTQFIAGNVDFAGSDSPLDEDQQKDAMKRCKNNPAVHLPMVIGPVAVAYHLEGVDQDLALSTKTVAKIFKGEIKKWNDPEIAKENDGGDLPDKDISVVYRADESGTSDNFQKFLKASAGDIWKDEGKAFPTPVGAGANGSTGVADQVSKTDGAITYVESGFLDGHDEMKAAKLDFGAGPVELNKDTVNKALAEAKFKGKGDDLIVDSEALYGGNTPDAYQLVLTTYEIVCSAGYDDQTRDLVKNLMYTMLNKQGEELEAAGYVPVEGEFKTKLEKAVESLS